MKKGKKLVLLLLAAAVVFAVTGCNKSKSGGSTGKTLVINIDPGEGYTSTKSMVKSDANPYPYNELEVLAKEYSAAHPGVEIKIAEVFRSGERDVLIPLLRSGRAPDIIYQNFGVFKNADLDTDWIVPVTKYLDEPNPYVPGNKKWSDLFVEPWLRVMRSTNGEYRFIPIDAIPIGMIYNKDLFAKAGITEPPMTFKAFMEDLEKLNAIGVIPYMTPYHWYDIFIEGSLLTEVVEKADVLTPDGIMDTEEYARAFEKGIIAGNGPEFAEYARIVTEKTKYYPTGWRSADVISSFVQGQVGIIEAVGANMRMIRDDGTRSFEVGTIPYPLVTTETTRFGVNGIVRGNAGYSTCWNITNTATNNGTVDACIDFCRFLTTPETNARLVNGLSSFTPAVVGAECVDLFKPLNDLVQHDIAAGFRDWHASSIHDTFDSEYNDYVENDIYPALTLGEITPQQYIDRLDAGARAAIARLEPKSGWDKSKW